MEASRQPIWLAVKFILLCLLLDFVEIKNLDSEKKNKAYKKSVKKVFDYIFLRTFLNVGKQEYKAEYNINFLVIL